MNTELVVGARIGQKCHNVMKISTQSISVQNHYLGEAMSSFPVEYFIEAL